MPTARAAAGSSTAAAPSGRLTRIARFATANGLPAARATNIFTSTYLFTSSLPTLFGAGTAAAGAAQKGHRGHHRRSRKVES